MTTDMDELLKLKGIGPKSAEILTDNGFGNLMAIAAASAKQLAGINGISETIALSAIADAQTKMDMGFVSGTEMERRRLDVGFIRTPCEAFNALLGGGVQTKSITEVHGKYASGKTQVSHTLAVTVQRPIDEGGLDGDVAFIDTENTYRPKRLRQIAESLGMNSDSVLDRMHVSRALSSDHQMMLVKQIENLLIEGKPIKLIIVDSLMAHFRAEYTGRGVLADRQQKIGRHLHALQKLADMYNVAILITNQVSANPASLFGGDIAIGGNIVAHASTYRIALRHGKAGTRVAKLIDAPELEAGEAVFKLCETGIGD